MSEESDLPKSLRDGRYAVVRLLGEGAQAATFEAVDKRDGRLVAVKRFRVRGAKSWKEVELAEREARVLASLEHASIPRYVEHFEEGGELFLVTEKIDGESLAMIRGKGATFSEADIVRLLRDASGALDYLHGRAPPIIHRDIKPSNVIRRENGSFALIDFGAVRDRMKPDGGSTVVGTFGYMAPEQFQGRAMPASDVYALGTTAIAMLTGVEPEDLPHKGLAIDVPTALRGTRVSPALARALARMVEPDPDKRASRIGPLLADLGARTRDRDRDEAASAPPLDKRDLRRKERERRREDRAVERMARGERRAKGRRGARGVPGFVMVLVAASLMIAQIAVTVTLRGVLPILFALLSVIFGERMRAAGRTVAAAGKRAAEAIGRAREVFSVRAQEEIAALEAEDAADARSHDPPAKVRFPSGPARGPDRDASRARDDEDAEAELDAEEAEGDRARRERRR